MGSVRLRYKLEFDLEVPLEVGQEPFAVAAHEEGEFARYPDYYLTQLPDDAKFTVEP